MTKTSPRIVYIVDDDEAVRESTQVLLESYGFAVRSCDSAHAFLEGFEPDDAGCIILDIHMPEMGGIELLSLLRSRGIYTPVIAITGRADKALDETAKRAGALALLSKPTDDEDLLQLVEQAVASRS